MVLAPVLDGGGVLCCELVGRVDTNGLEEPVHNCELGEPAYNCELEEPAYNCELGEPAYSCELEEPVYSCELGETAYNCELEEPAYNCELEEPAYNCELGEPAYSGCYWMVPFCNAFTRSDDVNSPSQFQSPVAHVELPGTSSS